MRDPARMLIPVVLFIGIALYVAYEFGGERKVEPPCGPPLNNCPIAPQRSATSSQMPQGNSQTTTRQLSTPLTDRNSGSNRSGSPGNSLILNR